ncbi:DUF2784 domain-containing protein [Pedobacter foliorum]|uniref:DUF2784 domain-containing protein n=1 Tax=Pedobacter foliorum TaxID=2739058 RepID=UPI001563E8E9|nr:DUF2784 domain-containing protein [Pedobacter foliorum]NRF37124.1 DUF2784 domain-containing protein [Pedobacter foliorum]
MYVFLDWFFTILHLIIIGFNLLGWIWRKTRKLHFVCVLLTAGSWLILGIWFGLGYCPITDWQWQIKEKLGATNLPNSFIKYFVDKVTGGDVSSSFVDIVTASCFISAVCLSVYLNFIKKKR